MCALHMLNPQTSQRAVTVFAAHSQQGSTLPVFKSFFKRLVRLPCTTSCSACIFKMSLFAFLTVFVYIGFATKGTAHKIATFALDHVLVAHVPGADITARNHTGAAAARARLDLLRVPILGQARVHALLDVAHCLHFSLSVQYDAKSRYTGNTCTR